MTRRCLVWILTGHLHLRPPLDDRSHPVPRHTLVEAGVAPLQRRDGHPGHAQGREEQAGWSGFCFLFFTAALPKRIYVTTFFSRTAAARTSKSLLTSTGRQLTLTMTSKH